MPGSSLSPVRPLVHLALLLTVISFFASRVVAEPGADTRLFLPVVITSREPAPAWLNTMNLYRELANLPPVVEDPALQEGAELHARYLVKNDVEVDPHAEDPANRWYTEAGNAAAGKSVSYTDPRIDRTDEQVIDAFMMAPFHALYLLNPALHRVGFGTYREADGGMELGAVLNIGDGIGDLPPGVTFPIMWPADGKVVPLRMHAGENPSPLTSCPGYSEPAGLPVLLQLGPGYVTPSVTEHRFSRGATALDHCMIDQHNYQHEDEATQASIRAILDYFDAVILIPRAPLDRGVTYNVQITSSGQAYSWSFTVDAQAR